MLSKYQQELRSKDIRVMTDEELDEWIVACTKMETIVRSKSSRRMWKESGVEALAEKKKRSKKSEEET